jgi:ATP synthase subunit 6
VSAYLAALAAGPRAAEHEGFQAPSAADFDLPPIFGNSYFFTKPMLQLLVVTLLVSAFFLLASRRRALVPDKLQFAGEGAYTFVRNGIARDIIGAHDFRRFVPWLFALFYFVLVNNLFGIIPLIQFPTMSKVGIPYVLTALTWIIYNGVGIARHGPLGYLKLMTVPAGVPKPLYLLIVPLEFVSNFLVRPVTLSLRLFANMFAGHLLLLVFILGGEYLLLHAAGLTKVAGIPALLLAIVFTFFEALVQSLQAYIFVLLSALYVAGSLAEEH